MSALPEMPCREFVERITDYLEGALEGDDLVRLEAHLGACPPCREYLAQLRRTLELTGELREEDVTPPMHDHLRRAFRDWARARG